MYFQTGYLFQTNVTVSHQGQWLQDANSLELFGSWLVIYINHFVNGIVEIIRTYEKVKYITLEKFFFHIYNVFFLFISSSDFHSSVYKMIDADYQSETK